MATTALHARPALATRATAEPVLVKLLLIAVALGFLVLFLVVPLVAVFVAGPGEGRGGLPGRARASRWRFPR